MKFLTFIAIFISLSSFAQINSTMNIGQGGWICSSEGMDDYPTIARGTSRLEAEHLAQKACANHEGSEFFCEIENCVQDTNAQNIDIVFVINRNGSEVSIRLSSGFSRHVCRSEAFNRSYIAEAPTLLEAEVLVRQTCISDGNHGMHCDIEKCESINTNGNVGGAIDIGPGIKINTKGIFGNL